MGTQQTHIRKRHTLKSVEIDWVAEEVPVALVYNGISYVVIMTTPNDLEALALGFSLSEGIISHPNDIFGMEILNTVKGIEIQIHLSNRRFIKLKEQRRNLIGRTGCGICGVESLNYISKNISPLQFTQKFDLVNLDKGLSQLQDYQSIGSLTGCTHAAAWMLQNGLLIGGCEDIGRHNALDKLLGYCSKNMWAQGALLISSRASYEIVQKSAMCGVEILFAISAVTKLAVDIAERYNLTLVGFSRPGRATVYTHSQRLF